MTVIFSGGTLKYVAGCRAWTPPRPSGSGGSPGGRSHLRPRVRQRAALGQVLRKAQVDAVVNRHHRAARRQRRQHVVRLVKDMGPCAQRARTAGENCSRIEYGPEVSTDVRKFSPSEAATSRSLPGRSGRSRSRGRIARARARCCGCTCRCRSRAACGHRSPLSRSQPLHPQVSLQPRRPAGQVLAIIGQVALLPRAVRRSRRRHARPAAQVHDFGDR